MYQHRTPDPDTLDPHDLVCIIDVDQQNRPAGDELNSPGRLLVGEGEIDDVSARIVRIVDRFWISEDWFH